ncbi:MAG: glycosyltransferase [Proteobacteria bacterium]|nr:glycosyltransferase [Pseudomonadota bacterium]
MSASSKTSGAFVFGSPVSVGHVRPLMPLAKRLVARGFTVVWAISGDDTEPASAWREPLAALGVTFVDLDETVPFPRGRTAEIAAGGLLASTFRRILARANDVAAGAAAAIRAAVGDQPIVGGVYDFFALWAYVAMRRLGIADLDALVSAFPGMLDDLPPVYADDGVYQRELAALRASGIGAFDEVPRAGVLPRDPALRVLSFSSPRLCPDVPAGVHVLGVQCDALPRVDDLATASSEHQALVQRLSAARADGARVVLLSMGTIVTRMFAKAGPAHLAFLRRMYTTLAASALRSGAIVIASTCDTSAAELGIDEAALGPAAQDRVIALPFVPQPLLFAHGLVDVMLMHGGANTFHEAVASGVPLLVSPAFGDQESVALAAAKLGVGVCVEAIMVPALAGAVSLERIADEVLPAMLAPGVSRWKAAATSLAAHVKLEQGLDVAEALVRAHR